MKQATQAEVKRWADEWAALDARVKRLEAARSAEVDPIVERHRAELEPVYAKHNPKINELSTKRDGLAKDVIFWLDNHNAPIILSGKTAIAASENKFGNRTISPKKFFDSVKEHTEAFWECFTVGIAKAEDLLGKTKVNELAEKPKKLLPSLTLK